MPLFEVDVLVTFRNKYVVEAEDIEHAKDEITWTEHERDFPEVTQRFLGEQIIDAQEISMEQFESKLEKYKNDKEEWASYWLGEKLIHKINYEK
jgi:hypothetical protein